MKQIEKSKMINVFGPEELAVIEFKAINRKEWISRHCKTLYITKYDKETNAFSYFVEHKSNRLHKFKDLSKQM